MIAVKFNPDEHVYCADCRHGEKLLSSVLQGGLTPLACTICYPFDPEDSRPFELRKRYKPIEDKNENNKA